MTKPFICIWVQSTLILLSAHSPYSDISVSPFILLEKAVLSLLLINYSSPTAFGILLRWCIFALRPEAAYYLHPLSGYSEPKSLAIAAARPIYWLFDWPYNWMTQGFVLFIWPIFRIRLSSCPAATVWRFWHICRHCVHPYSPVETHTIPLYIYCFWWYSAGFSCK